MRVLVTGAYGLIGSACLARLYRDGHALTGAGRLLGDARRRFPYAHWVKADFARLTSAEAWRPLLDGMDAVVNCVGVLQDSARDDTFGVHVTATGALFDACAQERVRRVVHISAIGAAAAGATAFSRTKAQSEAYLASLDLDWMILRPALVLAPAVYGGTAMLRGVAAIPWVTPLIEAESRIQVVSIDDVAACVAFCIAPGAPTRLTWDVAHPQVHSLGNIVSAIRRWLGYTPVPLIQLPHAVVVLATVVADGLGWLGWRSPARSTAVAQLAAGVVGDPAPWIAATGMRPRSLDDILAAQPASVQERWFARLYLIKPLAIGALALFWIATGVIALGPGRAAAMARLAEAGMQQPLADITIVGGAIFDIVLGLLLLVRRAARAVLATMLAATVVYLVVGSILAAQLWLDPLGPFTKIVPMLVATLFTLAVLDER